MNDIIGNGIILRNARLEDFGGICEMERLCFPPNEAEKPENVLRRLRHAPAAFLVAEDAARGALAGFVCGMPTDERSFRDEFFTDESLYDPHGENVIMLSLEVHPDYRGMGIARRLMEGFASREAAAGRRALILTCHEALIGMYEGLGFIHNGLANSCWGGETWHEMRRALDEES